MRYLYIHYLECKLGFTEKLVDSLMNLYNKGGTYPVFPSFDEWKQKHLGSEEKEK